MQRYVDPQPRSNPTYIHTLHYLDTRRHKSHVCYYLQLRSPEDAAMCERAQEFRPPEWLTQVVARTTPYFPQMDDEVIYFVQGHQQYVDAVKTNDIYPIDVDRNQPWHKMPQIRVCRHFLHDVCCVLPSLIYLSWLYQHSSYLTL